MVIFCLGTVHCNIQKRIYWAWTESWRFMDHFWLWCKGLYQHYLLKQNFKLPTIHKLQGFYDTVMSYAYLPFSWFCLFYWPSILVLVSSPWQSQELSLVVTVKLEIGFEPLFLSSVIKCLWVILICYMPQCLPHCDELNSEAYENWHRLV